MPMKTAGWHQRWELLVTLAFKELKVRYKSSWLGFLWSLVVPLSLMGVFIVIFRYVMRFDITPTFLLAALFPWTFFSLTISSVTGCFVDNGNLIKKVVFPRELLFASVVMANFINFCLSMLVLLCFDIRWSWHLLAVPLVMLLQLIFTTGLALVVAAAQVYCRDTRYLVEIALLLWFYLTPVFYSLDLVQNISKRLLYLFLLNPLAGLTVMYRDLIIHGMFSSRELITFTAAVCLAFGLGGWLIFRRMRYNLADHV
ncbi:MAG TPA: ABC transporter permease [bacterium]|nr:ABC transporter permease [bacterium]